jgi:carnitine O-acetyltransferase
MAVRTFTRPSSIEHRLALAADKVDMASANNNTKQQNPTEKDPQSTPKAGVTYAYQDQLPTLPIPELEASCQKYLDALRPLQSPKEHSDTKVCVKEFLKYEGPKLQEKLKKYAQGRPNYIEQFCKFSSILLCHPTLALPWLHSC